MFTTELFWTFVNVLLIFVFLFLGRFRHSIFVLGRRFVIFLFLGLFLILVFSFNFLCFFFESSIVEIIQIVKVGETIFEIINFSLLFLFRYLFRHPRELLTFASSFMNYELFINYRFLTYLALSSP